MPAGLSTPGVVAAHAERQGRSPRPAGAHRAGACLRPLPFTSPRATSASRGPGRDLGAGCSAASGSESTTTSSSWAAIRCSGSRWSRAPARRASFSPPSSCSRTRRSPNMAADGGRGVPRSGRKGKRCTGAVPLAPVQRRFFGRSPRSRRTSTGGAPQSSGGNWIGSAGRAGALGRLAGASRRPCGCGSSTIGEGWRQLASDARRRQRCPFVSRSDRYTPRGQRAALEAAAEGAAVGLDVGSRARWIAGGGSSLWGRRKPSRLLLVTHHLIVDAVSWRMLVEDLAVAYRQLAAGLPGGAAREDHVLRKRWALLARARPGSPELGWRSFPPGSPSPPFRRCRSNPTSGDLRDVGANGDRLGRA